MSTLPVGPAQHMVYLDQARQPASTAYNIAVCVDLPFALTADALEPALGRLVAKYELLRAAFVLRDDAIHQVIDPAGAVEVERYDGVDAAQAEFVRPFALDRGPLLRAGVVPLGLRSTKLLLDVHHIVADGVSLSPLIADLARALRGQPLEPERYPFRTYLEWCEGADYRARTRRAAAFWEAALTPVPARAHWATDHACPMSHGANYDLVRFPIDGEEAARLHDRARATQTSAFTFALTAFALTQADLTGDWDAAAAVVTAGRVHPRFLKTFGMFANTLCLRLGLTRAMSVSGALERVREATLTALRYQEFPAVDLARLLRLPPAPGGQHPLFECLFAYQNITYQKQEFFGRTFRQFFEGKHDVQFDMVVHMFERGTDLDVQWEFTPRRYARATVGLFADHFRAVLGALSLSDGDETLDRCLQRRGPGAGPSAARPADFDF